MRDTFNFGTRRYGLELSPYFTMLTNFVLVDIHLHLVAVVLLQVLSEVIVPHYRPRVHNKIKPFVIDEVVEVPPLEIVSLLIMDDFYNFLLLKMALLTRFEEVLG